MVVEVTHKSGRGPIGKPDNCIDRPEFGASFQHIVKSYGLVRQGDRIHVLAAFEFVKAHQAQYPIATQCRVLKVSISGYYAWCKRERSARSRTNDELSRRIVVIHRESRETCGMPRVHAELRAQGEVVGKHRVRRLMRANGIVGVTRRRRIHTTRRDRNARPAPDLVRRAFTASEPDRLWVADITYVPTMAGFLFLAVVLDVFSRRIVGWSMAASLHTQVVLNALEMALQQRRPGDVIHHSDQGSQYTSIAFGLRCKAAAVSPSMGSVGDCYDNAMCESFFATLECELIDRNRFANRYEAELAIFDYLESWYNSRRRHSALGYRSPVDFERDHAGHAAA